MAFIALCRTEPDNFPEHLKLLRSYFCELHKKRGASGAYLTAIRFVQFVDLYTISQKLWLLYFTTHPNETVQIQSDNWFGKALFLGDKAPLLLTKEEHFYIQRTSSGYKERVILPRPSSLRYISPYNDISRFFNHIIEERRMEIPMTNLPSNRSVVPVYKLVNNLLFCRQWKHHDIS